jgi:hypothetical protein
MRKLSLLLSALMLVSAGIAQYVPTPDEVERFFNTKTMVVLDANILNTFDQEIREAMENEWTITEYEFLPFDKFQNSIDNPGYSFLYLANVVFEKDKTNATYKFLNLSLGGKGHELNDMPDLVSVPVGYKNVDEDSYNYKLGILVRFIQNHIQLIRDNPDIISANVFKHYNDNIKDIQGKTLYLIESELDKELQSPSKVRAVYPYKFEFVTREQIKQAIKDRDESVVFLHKVGPEGTRMNARCYKVLIGAADANFYYFDYHNISDKKPDGLLESDFKKLRK